MKISGFYEESISNGIGWRAVLFVSGCPHHCIGCHNPHTQDFNYGTDFNKEEIISKIVNNSILNGITLSGGEPLCNENIPELLDFVKDIRSLKPEFNVWCYTGYTIEELMERNDYLTNEILENIDVLVDGEFMIDKKNPSLKFRGSENQRILDVRRCISENKIVSLAV